MADILSNRCVDEVVLGMEKHVDTVRVLPRILKSKLLVAASKRGTLTSKILHCLLHPDVKELNLNKCNVCDDSIRAIYTCTHLWKLHLNSEAHQRTGISTAGIDIQLFFCSKHWFFLRHKIVHVKKFVSSSL
jgi:hypothetical protein